MLSILIISQRGEGYEYVEQLEKEGHVVKLWIADIPSSKLITHRSKVDRYEKHTEAADVVIYASGGACTSARDLGETRALILGRVLPGVVNLEVVSKMLQIEIAQEDTTGRYLSFSGFFSEKFLFATQGETYLRLLNKDRGPLTLGNAWLAEPASQEAWDLLDRLTPLLSALNFSGICTLDFVYKDGLKLIRYSLEQSTAWYAILREGYGTLFSSFLIKMLTKSEEKSDSFNGVVVSSILPVLQAAKLKDTKQAGRHFLPSAITDNLGQVTAVGNDLREARRRLYRTLGNIAPVESMHRTDIGVDSIFIGATDEKA